MKTRLWRIGVLLTLLSVSSYVFTSESVATGRGQSLLDLPVGNLSLEEANVPLLLSRIAYKYDVPIGVEVSRDDDLLNGTKVILQMNSGTLRDALDAVISQNPLYTWNMTDDVINVVPRALSRDLFLKALLETRFQNFSIERGEPRIHIRESLTTRPELRRLLKASGVRAVNETFISRDSRPLDRDFSLDVSNLTVRTILNRVIKDSKARYWIVNRYGKNRRYLLLNL